MADEPSDDERELAKINNPVPAANATERLVGWVEQARAAGHGRGRVDDDLRAWANDVRDRHAGQLPGEAVTAFLAASQRNADILDATDLVTPPLLATATEVTPTSKAAKHDSVVYFSVRITPSTDVTATADDITNRFSQPDSTMQALNVWVEGAAVGVQMRYHAKGANSNDVRRRLLAATPVGSEQVVIKELLSINLDADPDERLACLLDAQEQHS